GWLASSAPAGAFFNFFEAYAPAPKGLLDQLDIPEEWAVRLGPSLPAYCKFLQSLGLQRLAIRQIIAPHTNERRGVRNALPPKPLWRNVRETLRVIDGLSRRLELRPREVVSVYRTPAYNARCPGARSNSWHLRNNAVDIKFPCSPGLVAAMLKEMRAAGVFRGGIGRYGGFTHVDTRGTNADWRA
ncbi:MAG: D-Ala-D-Ala carboxypeptidase family metallohydrolase, partial [Terrimicrobiaceae bacterium]|nr:D-Ala-D-Ala carboxypeptidase family metallohydrolase [Terrimicrobiaceae bacterium]